MPGSSSRPTQADSPAWACHFGHARALRLLAPIWRIDPRLIRAGDIKLYMCIGAFLGWKGVLMVVLYGHLFKGLAALVQLGMFQVEKRRASTGEARAALVAPTHTPAALPIFAGTLLHTTLPHLLL